MDLVAAWWVRWECLKHVLNRSVTPLHGHIRRGVEVGCFVCLYAVCVCVSVCLCARASTRSGWHAVFFSGTGVNHLKCSRPLKAMSTFVL